MRWRPRSAGRRRTLRGRRQSVALGGLPRYQRSSWLLARVRRCETPPAAEASDGSAPNNREQRLPWVVNMSRGASSVISDIVRHAAVTVATCTYQREPLLHAAPRSARGDLG